MSEPLQAPVPVPGTAEYRRSKTIGPRMTGGLKAEPAILPPTFENEDEAGPSKIPASQFKAKPDILVQGRISVTNTINTPSEILCVKYSDTFDELACGSTDGVVRLYAPGTSTLLRELGTKTAKGIICTVTGINHRATHNSPNSLTCTYVDGLVKAWNCKTGACLYAVNEKRQVYGIAYHHQLPKFATVGDDGKVLLYDEETKTQERVFQSSNTKSDIMDGHKSRVFSSCFNPKSTHELISGGWDDTVQFWDMRQPHAIRHLSGVHMCGDGMDINSNGNEIITCAWQKTNPMQLWDYGTGKLIASLEPDAFNSVLYCGKWVGKEIIAAGGAEPNLLRFVNQRTMMSMGSVQNLPGAVFALSEGGLSAKAKAKVKTAPKKFADTPVMPRVAFCSGKRVYEVEPA